ncbi:hypothetical protein [Streptomyces shenzhenensis]|uniref:Uncharacterized protein n=1 Tax=Streptomyces shenzhenensis TaxID=943815 RepID=A0A3M0HTW7_9ACTN|nr:hypothetical protein [Streptomyces shenzhenensis]RMB79994.1 hypothetical protein CTZ28_42560 [Streptomyces shenzhenensis]
MSVTAFAPQTEARLALARKVADAVLFEGYVLYPYRASAAKNRLRWQFGVLVPPGWGAECEEHAFQHTECLLEPRAGATLAVELRFLRARRRTVQRACGDGEFETVPELRLADRVLVPWDEGVEERVETAVPVADVLAADVTVPFQRPAGTEHEAVLDPAGRTAGRTVHRYAPLTGRLRLSAAELDGPHRVVRLTAVVENTSDWTPPAGHAAARDAALPRSLVAAHLLMAVDRGSFLSMTDPPQWARGAVAACRNLHTWPVLAGEPGRADVVLSSPIILEDHPAIAPESPGALYDATEIDEILALRTAALTDEEKREARGTDERAAAVLDLADSLPPEVLERLHGAVRGLREVTRPATGTGFPDEHGVPRPDTPWWDPAGDAGIDPGHDRVLVDGRPAGAGSRLVLRPGLRRTDAQDVFLYGRTATVEAVLHDVDGVVHLAVTADGDPGADLRREQGRFLYFRPDELAWPEEDG